MYVTSLTKLEASDKDQKLLDDDGDGVSVCVRAPVREACVAL
jgi:hypothetical protein